MRQKNFLYIIGCLILTSVIGISCNDGSDRIDLSKPRGSLTYYYTTTLTKVSTMDYCKVVESSSHSLPAGYKAVDLYLSSTPIDIAESTPSNGTSELIVTLVFEDSKAGLLPGGKYRKQASAIATPPAQFQPTCLNITGGANWDGANSTYEYPIAIDFKEPTTTDGDAFVNIIPLGDGAYQILFMGTPVSSPGCSYKVEFLGLVN